MVSTSMISALRKMTMDMCVTLVFVTNKFRGVSLWEIAKTTRFQRERQQFLYPSFFQVSSDTIQDQLVINEHQNFSMLPNPGGHNPEPRLTVVYDPRGEEVKAAQGQKAELCWAGQCPNKPREHLVAQLPTKCSRGLPPLSRQLSATLSHLLTTSTVPAVSGKNGEFY